MTKRRAGINLVAGRCTLIKIFLAMIVAGLLGCTEKRGADSTNDTPNTVDSRDNESRNKFFAENLENLTPDVPGQARAIEALRAFRNAYERHDIDDVADRLAQGFEFLYVFGGDRDEPNVFAQTREEYISKRGDWEASDTPRVRLHMAVKSFQHWPDLGLTSVVVATERESKFFNPKFLETYLFKEQDGHPRLDQLSMAPIYPPSPDLYEVSIFFADLKPPHWYLGDTDIRKDIIAIGPDAAFEKYIRTFSTRAPDRARDGDHIPVIVIFREPPPGGAQIDIVETQRGGQGRTFTSRHKVAQSGDPYFFLSGIGWFGSRGSIEVKALVNGVVVGKKTLILPP